MNEQKIQEYIADYLVKYHSDVVFHSDFGSGTKLSKYQAVRQKKQNGGRSGWPDMFIAEPRGKYSGLFIELKRDGVRIFKKDGTLVSDGHIRDQFDVLSSLRARGYAADFAIGYEDAIKKIENYLRDYHEND